MVFVVNHVYKYKHQQSWKFISSRVPACFSVRTLGGLLEIWNTMNVSEGVYIQAKKYYN